jgi:ABC-type multidrug transport system ATPase subunit
VFGSTPGSAGSNIPGSGVGYMPQELALFGNFTIEETLYYFGMLHHMSRKAVSEKLDFFIALLNLPPKDRKVEQCSGGQQRRVSLATALFHNPPFLILDEPTVGLDPLLRCKIWEYLEQLCFQYGMSMHIECQCQ